MIIPPKKDKIDKEARLSDLEDEDMYQNVEVKFADNFLKPPVSETPLNTEQNEDEENKEEI